MSLSCVESGLCQSRQHNAVQAEVSVQSHILMDGMDEDHNIHHSGMQALPALLIREVALRSADPSSWACITIEASSTLGGEPDAAFELDWFLRWQPVLLPHRPWQYAVLTWRRMQGAPPHRIARFMLRVLQAKQQQHEQHQQRQQPDGKQKQQADDLESVARKLKYAELFTIDGQFCGRFPELRPLRSTLSKVHKLLGRQQAAGQLRALLLLCPCGTPLLAQYAGRDRTRLNDAVLPWDADVSSSSSSQEAWPLLQRLMQQPGLPRPSWYRYHSVYTIHPLLSSRASRGVNLHRLCCSAALAAGRVPTLLWRLPAHFRTNRRGKRMQLRPLLPFAARFSNAACVQAVFLQFEPAERRYLLAPQHLAMAAGRSDPWAADVVKLLLQLLSPKQLKPSHMRAAYSAACATGYLPVLQLLVSHAAQAATQHLPVLLEALVGSGNRMVAELLLGDTPAAVQQLHQQHDQDTIQLQQDEEQQQQQLSAAVRSLQTTWQQLHGALQLKVLGNVLPQSPPSGEADRLLLAHPSTLLVDLHNEAMRLHVADLLWQLLPDHAQAALQPRHACAAVTAPGAAGTGSSTALPTSWFGRAFWLVELSSSSRSPARLMWMLEHRLEPRIGPYIAIKDHNFRCARNTALQAGHRAALRMALHLHPLVAQWVPRYRPAKPVPCDAMAAVMALFDGRLVEACSACDSEALQQLEQLFMLCFMLLTPRAIGDAALALTTDFCCAPTLPVSLTAGRLVTVAHLSAGLGLPCKLLGALLAAAEYEQLATGSAGPALRTGPNRAPVAGSSGSDAQACSTQQQLVDATLAVQNPEAALHAGDLLSDHQPSGVDTLEPLQPEQHQQVLHFMLATRTDMLQPRAAHAAMLDMTHEQSFEHLQEHPELVMQLMSAYHHGLQQLMSQQEQPLLQQERQGPPPLWQQALLQLVAQNAPELREQAGPARAAGPYRMFKSWAGQPFSKLSSAYAGPGLLLLGLRAGRSAQAVQQFISTRLFSTSRPAQGPPPPQSEPFGEHLLREALVYRAPELLSWSLQPTQQQVVWGSGPDAASVAVAKLALTDRCSPITCRVSALNGMASSTDSMWKWGKCLHQQQELPQQDLAELRQQRLQLLGPAGAAVNLSCGPMQAAAGPLPQFARSAVQMALILLQHPSMAPDTLDTWLRYTVGVRSSLPDLVRARAIVAAVAAAEVLPPGARVLNKETVRQVLAVADPDLWSVVLLWCHRLPLESHFMESDDDDAGFPLGAGDWEDDLDDQVAPGGPLHDPAGVAELAAAVDAVNI